MSIVDTTPGARCVMAPNSGQDLDADGYRALMRDRYRDQGCRQHMAVIARRMDGGEHCCAVPFVGPHAGEARKILETMR